MEDERAPVVTGFMFVLFQVFALFFLFVLHVFWFQVLVRLLFSCMLSCFSSFLSICSSLLKKHVWLLLFDVLVQCFFC